jgi:multidrug efflux pump subunit AcrA (membrane-fusion protein)
MSCTQSKKETVAAQYTCPMHPEIVQEKPGTCPICFMDLVQKNREGVEIEMTSELNYLLKPTNATVMSSIKTITPKLDTMMMSTQFNGVITYDTRNAVTISSRIAGRVEKLFVKYKLQQIHRGQKILEIYSPELVAAQRDLIYLLQSDAENSQMINSAKEKLRLLGASEQQIVQVVSSKKEMNSFPVFSSADGFVTIGENEEELPVREGMYLNAGQSIVNIINAQQVWAEFDVPQNDASQLKVNSAIELKFDQEDAISARVNFVQPFFKAEAPFAKVRVYLNNPQSKYKIGQLVTGETKQQRKALWIPASARIDLGNKEIVFVKDEGIFRPRLIVTVKTPGDKLEVIEGVTESDSIAYDAHFMIDSESFVKIKD